MSETNELLAKIEELTDRMDKSEKRNNDMINNLIAEFNKALSCFSEDISKQMNSLADYSSKRFDDIERRLEKLELDMDIVRRELTNVSNWTKTGDKIYELTRTHAYEIPRIEVRLRELEKDNESKEN